MKHILKFTRWCFFAACLTIIPCAANAAVAQNTARFYVPILMYHHIAVPKHPNPYFVAPEIFDQQMKWLVDNGYHNVSYEMFYQAMIGRAHLPPKPFVLTFDDGDRDQYENAFPILKKYGYSAMFYIVTRYTASPAYMSWDMLHTLVHNGMEIGAHTLSHPNLARLPLSAARYELEKSKAVLEYKLGIPIYYMAYPGGAYSRAVVQAVFQAGYRSAVTVRHSVYHVHNENLFLVPRIHIDSDMASFARYVQGVGL